MALAADYSTETHYEVGRSADKNRYTAAVSEGGVEGYADFIELTKSTTTRTYALTLGACQDEMAIIELLAFFEASDANTTGSYTEENKIIHSFTFDKTVSYVEMKMANWTAKSDKLEPEEPEPEDPEPE